MSFTARKAGQSLQGMELQDEENLGKLFSKNPKMKGIYQNNEGTCHRNEEVEPIYLVQMNIYQKNTRRKDLSWLHIDDELQIQERQREQQ